MLLWGRLPSSTFKSSALEDAVAEVAVGAESGAPMGDERKTSSLSALLLLAAICAWSCWMFCRICCSLSTLPPPSLPTEGCADGGSGVVRIPQAPTPVGVELAVRLAPPTTDLGRFIPSGRVSERC